jgi:glucan-binding YG repeat protein
MRKQTKLVAVLSAAALLAIGASMTSFAAQGWAEEDGTWVYYDKDGDRVTDTWKKSGTQFFYLNWDGEMATSTLIEDDSDKYYVDENGAKVTNRWVSLDNEDDVQVNGEDVDTIWYYFDGNGKAVKGDSIKNKTINGKKYFFDTDGYMMSGWYEEDKSSGGTETYYLGDENEGWAYTDWHSLEPKDSDAEAYDDTEWFYFASSGKAKKNTRAYINKKYYAFDEQGVMKNKWIVGTPPKADGAYYNADVGYQETGWVYVYEKNEDRTINEDGDEKWFYLDSKGVAFNDEGKQAGASASTATKRDGDGWEGTAKTKVAAKVVKSKTYLFDNTGRMLTGVYDIDGVERTGSSSDLDGIYYFNTGSGSVEGQMMTGKQTINFDGDSYYYSFDKSGKAYVNSIADGCLYNKDGVRVNAEDGNNYRLVYVGDTDDNVIGPVSVKGKVSVKIGNGDVLVVNKGGKVKQSGKVRIDGYEYVVEGYKAQLPGKPID